MEAKPNQREPKGHDKWTFLRERLIWTAPPGQRGAKRRETEPNMIEMEAKDYEKEAKWKATPNQREPQDTKNDIAAKNFYLDRPTWLGRGGGAEGENVAKWNQQGYRDTNLSNMISMWFMFDFYLIY